MEPCEPNRQSKPNRANRTARAVRTQKPNRTVAFMSLLPTNQSTPPPLHLATAKKRNVSLFVLGIISNKQISEATCPEASRFFCSGIVLKRTPEVSRFLFGMNVPKDVQKCEDSFPGKISRTQNGSVKIVLFWNN